MSENKNCTPIPKHNSRLNALSNKFEQISGKTITIGISILIALMSMLYTDMKDRVGKMEERVTFLYNDKLSRGEFMDTMRDLKEEMLISRKDTDRQLQLMRSEILERIDLMIQYSRNSK